MRGRHRIARSRLLLLGCLAFALSLTAPSVATAYDQYTPQCVLRAGEPQSFSTDYSFWVTGTNDCDFFESTTQSQLQLEVCAQEYTGYWHNVTDGCVNGNGQTSVSCALCGKLYEQLHKPGSDGEDLRTWVWGWDRDLNGNTAADTYLSSSVFDNG